MYISKPIHWLKPYLKEAKVIFPKLKMLTSLRSGKPNRTKLQKCHGAITYISRNHTYKIFLFTLYTNITSTRPFRQKLLPYSKIDALSYLAHELAHMYYWDHCTKHKRLEARLTSMFLDRLENEGYISEEDELSGSKKHCRKSV